MACSRKLFPKSIFRQINFRLKNKTEQKRHIIHRSEHPNCRFITVLRYKGIILQSCSQVSYR